MAKRIPMKLSAVAGGVAVFASLVLASGSANAIGLMAAYEAALKNDSTYRAATHERDAGKENRIMGRAGLLPNLSGNYNAAKNHNDVETVSQTILGPQTNLTHPKYISRTAGIYLRQAIVNFEATARYREGVAQSKASETQFAGRKQELALRVIGAYLDALFSNEQVKLITAQRDTYSEQAKVNDRMYKGGEASITDKHETQARLDISEAQLLEAKDNQAQSYETLKSIIGEEPGTLDPLVESFRPRVASQDSMTDWITRALGQNAEVQTQTFAVDIAREQVNKGKAGHMPRLDLVGSYAKTAAETVSTFNQDSTVRSVGIQLSVPLYAGGYYSAATRQAVANQERAKANLQASIDKIKLEVNKEYLLEKSTTERVLALEKAVESAKLLVKATEQSIKGGVRINLDLLNAQQQLFSSQRDLAQARFGHLLAGLRLRAAAGALQLDDVRAVAAYFR